MSNIISFDGKVTPDDDSLVMTNGGTDVLIHVLALSGSEIARTESEKRLIVYLAEKDQMIGRGYVGFDIIEMPWDKKSFKEDKNFIIKVIHGARNKIGWEILDYCPNEEVVSSYLNTFENLIHRMTIHDIKENALNHWLSEAEANDPIYCGFPRCKKHNIFLTCFGCQICNCQI